MKKFLFFTLLLTCLLSCENYSNGERVGYIVKFSEKGSVWKTWEGEMNLSQTGTMQGSIWEFSIDRKNASQETIDEIKKAVENGSRVKLTYHETAGKNCMNNRGNTNYFITEVKVLN